MALGNGGLDAQVEARMDAYRSNPQQLQQRYGQNKELLDLLALQKLTSEKKAVAADMQMKAQQNPNTIAQQREQEALELTKQEMGGTLGQLAANTKGTLDQKQALQQKNMGRLAQNAARPQPGPGAGLAGLVGGAARPPARPAQAPARPAQGGGVEGMLMARNAQRPNAPVRMAQGGIVSFANGKKVTLTEDQKKKAREIYGPLYNNVITPLLQMDEDNPAAALILERLGPAVQSTPLSRGIDNLKSYFGNAATRANLEKQVREKFRSFAAPVTGAFKQQSAEQQAYAKSVLAALPTLDDAQLDALLAIPFSEGMDPTAVAALPVVSPSIADPSTDTPPVVAAPTDNMPPISPITYEAPAYETEMSQLDETVLNVPTITVGSADESEVDAAQNSLLGAVGNVPEDYVPEEFTRTPLEPVDPSEYLDEQGLEARRFLLQRGSDLAGADVDAEISSARESADAYSMRDEKNAMFRDQLAKEQALQDRILDPKRVEKLKRMETYAGGAKYGRGGIGQGFVESERRFDELESGGLKTLRDIQDNAITNDYNLVAQGIGAGSRAGARAQADRVAGANIALGEINRQKEMATNQQTGQQAVTTANTQAANVAMSDAYNAAAAALNAEVSARQTILSQEAVELRVDAARLVQQGENAQKAAVESAKNKITQAQNADNFAAERARIQLLDIREAEKLFYEHLAKLEAEKSAILDSDRNFQVLRANLAAAETEAEFEAANNALMLYDDAMETLLANRFATAYARLSELRQRVDAGRAQNIYTGGIPSALREDDPNVTVDPVE
jgi:hypothetical protein